MDRLTVTATEAAQMLGISRSSAHGCVLTGELRVLSLGQRLVVPRAALEELLAGPRVAASAPCEAESSC